MPPKSLKAKLVSSVAHRTMKRAWSSSQPLIICAPGLLMTNLHLAKVQFWACTATGRVSVRATDWPPRGSVGWACGQAGQTADVLLVTRNPRIPIRIERKIKGAGWTDQVTCTLLNASKGNNIVQLRHHDGLSGVSGQDPFAVLDAEIGWETLLTYREGIAAFGTLATRAPQNHRCP